MQSSIQEREARIARYAAGPSRLRAALDAVPAEALDWRPAPGKWSVHEVVSHCADSEANAYGRIRYVLAEPEPVIVGYDQDRWAEVFGYLEQPIALSLAVIDAVRAATVSLLRRLPDDAWSREGRHTEVGRYPATKWLEIYSDHLETHAAQIARTLGAWREHGGTR
jgi:hypothetical protein